MSKPKKKSTRKKPNKAFVRNLSLGMAFGSAVGYSIGKPIGRTAYKINVTRKG